MALGSEGGVRGIANYPISPGALQTTRMAVNCLNDQQDNRTSRAKLHFFQPCRQSLGTIVAPGNLRVTVAYRIDGVHDVGGMW